MFLFRSKDYADVLETQPDELGENSDKESYGIEFNEFIENDKIGLEKPRRGVSRRMAAKQKRIEFKKLFAENRHRFDMTCDLCTKSFETLDEVRSHYASAHNNAKGYIKCCNVKLTYRCEVVRHLYRHLDPNKFKCDECGKVYHALHVLRAHIKQHTETVEKECLICDICKKTFASKVGLKRHLQWHSVGSKSENEQYNKFIGEQNIW